MAEYKWKFPKYDWTADIIAIPVNFAQEHKKIFYADCKRIIVSVGMIRMVNLILKSFRKGSIRNNECCQGCWNGSEQVFRLDREAN
jgi:hypothetical protein